MAKNINRTGTPLGTTNTHDEYNQLTKKQKADVIRFFNKQAKEHQEIKQELLRLAHTYYNPVIFGRNNEGGLSKDIALLMVDVIEASDKIQLLPPGDTLQPRPFWLNELIDHEVLKSVVKFSPLIMVCIKDGDELATYTGLYEIIQLVRHDIIQAAILNVYKKQTKHKSKEQLRVSSAAVTAQIQPFKSEPDLFDNLLPPNVIVGLNTNARRFNGHTLKNAKGMGINIEQKQDDLLIAIRELIYEKSNTQDPTKPNYYLGEATETKTVLDINTGQQIQVSSPGVVTTWAAITKRMYGSTSASDKRKVKGIAFELWKNPDYHPILKYPIIEYSTTRNGRKKNVTRHVITNDPIITIRAIQDIDQETGEDITQDGTIQIFINPIYIANIKDRYQKRPTNFLEQRRDIGRVIGRKAPKFFNSLYERIANAKTFKSNQKNEDGERVYKEGLLRNRGGEPGLYYSLGYANYLQNGHRQRFLKEYESAILFLKHFGLITEYQEVKNDVGEPIGVFTYKKG